MVDDRVLFESTRYATLFIAGAVLFAAGVWEVTPAIQQLVECSTAGATCAEYVRNAEWVYVGSALFFFLVSGIMFIAARAARRSLRFPTFRESGVEAPETLEGQH
jgi:hypothetical protein